MSNAAKVRIGLVGCGAIAELYHLPALAANPRSREGIALAEPHDERRQRFAQQFNAVAHSADYRELVDSVDGVIIATPPTTHHEIAKCFCRRANMYWQRSR